MLHAAGRDADARPVLESVIADGAVVPAAVHRALGDIAYRAEDWAAATVALAAADAAGVDDPAARRSVRLRLARSARSAGRPTDAVRAADDGGDDHQVIGTPVQRLPGEGEGREIASDARDGRGAAPQLDRSTGPESRPAPTPQPHDGQPDEQHDAPRSRARRTDG